MSSLGYDGIASVLYDAGFRGEGLINGIATVSAESGGDPGRIGHNVDAKVNPTGQNTIDRGLWQLNSYWHREVPDSVAYDAAGSSREAYRISGGGRTFAQWYGFTKGGYRDHLDAARKAAAAVEQRGGSAGVGTSTTADAGTSSTANAAGEAQGSARKVTPPDAPVDVPYGDSDAFIGLGPQPIGRETLQLHGAPVNVEGSVAGRIIDGPNVDLQLAQISEISFTVADPEFAAFAQGLVMTGMSVDFLELRMRLATVELTQGTAGGAIACTAQDVVAWLMKGDRFPWSGNSVFEVVHAIGDYYANLGLLRSTMAPPAIVDEPIAKVVDTEDPAGGLETTWAFLGRIAKERGYLFAVVGGVLYVERPTAIAAAAPSVVVWASASSEFPNGDPRIAYLALEWPKCRRSEADMTRAGAEFIPGKGAKGIGLETITVKLPQERASRLRPAHRLELHGVPSFDGSYLVTRVGGPGDGVTPWTVDAEKPIDPPKEPGTTGVGTDTAALPGSSTAQSTTKPADRGTASALDFVDLCMKQAGKAYVYGAEARLDDPDPKAFDCSELIQWACAQVGLSYPDGSGNQYQASKNAGLLVSVDQAARIRGALLWRGAGGSEHVVVSLGDGKATIEARGRQYGVVQATIEGRGWSAAGLIPGMDYGRVTTSATRRNI